MRLTHSPLGVPLAVGAEAQRRTEVIYMARDFMNQSAVTTASPDAMSGTSVFART
ncbi:hypothetical protein [Nostoc sp. MS1]|uniref:hypothetical protein n=1 Tax=Nostoc sp. MS1 TaxID=2764711 RepID=UPI00398C3381